MKLNYLFIAILFSYVSYAQKTSLAKEVEQIEYLVEYNYTEKAQQKADSLLPIIEKYGKAYLEYELRIKLQIGIMYEIKEENKKALEVLLEMVDKANDSKFYKIACHTNIVIASIYEKDLNEELTKKYLEIADRLRKKHNIQELYSTILIRRSLYHRWFAKDLDSAMYYAKIGHKYAEKYNNEYDIVEAKVMIGIYESNKNNNYQEALKYFPSTGKYYLKTNNYNDASLMYINAAVNNVKLNNLELALKYSDTAFAISKNASIIHQTYISKYLAELYEKVNNIDSAYHYLKLHRDLREQEVELEEAATLKNITEQYDNDKNEATIKSKNQQMVFVSILLMLILITAILLIYQNKKIKNRNKIISNQIADLSKMLEHKQVLLSELQHRVKNNLQHVISILEIQKESIDFNNIEELVRGNQNRIQTMALLHKKLNVSDNVNEVDFPKYITELAQLVKESYDSHKKKIDLNIKCDVKVFSIEKSLPLGLIITELVSNSMKHAFKKKNSGVINISITQEDDCYILNYADNGVGFDFNKTHAKGLGQEIIKGLIDQLNGQVSVQNDNGCNIKVVFNL